MPYYLGKLSATTIAGDTDISLNQGALGHAAASAARFIGKDQKHHLWMRDVRWRFFLNVHPMGTLKCLARGDVLIGSLSHFTVLAAAASRAEVVVVPEAFEAAQWCGELDTAWCTQQLVSTSCLSDHVRNSSWSRCDFDGGMRRLRHRRAEAAAAAGPIDDLLHASVAHEQSEAEAANAGAIR